MIKDKTIKEDGFPIQYLLVILGYALILLVDKVVFDTHAVFGHDHGEEGGHGQDDPEIVKDPTGVQKRGGLDAANDMNADLTDEHQDQLSKNLTQNDRANMFGALVRKSLH